MGEKVPDPEFNNLAAWSFVGTGASITGGQLRFVNATIVSSNTIPAIDVVVGAKYSYRIEVERYPNPIKAEILFGGVKIYDEDGVGVFSGEVTPINTTGLIFLAQLAGQWYLDRISIMASAEAEVYTALTGYAGLTALVNNSDSPLTYRIYPLVMPQDETLPAVVYQRIVGTRIVTMSDAGGTGVERIVFQFTTWSTTMKEAHDVMEQVRLALVAASFEVVPLSNRSVHEPDTRLFGMEYDFAIWHR